MFFDEWNVLLKLNLLGSVGIHFRMFGQDYEISLKSIASSDIDVYASLGGMTTRKWCGEYSNPLGIFLSLMVDINPFEKVPLLKHGLLDFNNRVYAFLATDPTTSTRRKDTDVLLDKLFDLRGMVESFTNTTVANVLRYSSLLVGESVELLNDLNHAASDFLRSLEFFFKELSQGKEKSVEHLINSMSTLWTNGLKKIEKDTELFLDSVERTTDIAKHNFTTLLKQEVDLIKLNLQNFRDELIQQVLDIFREFQGFGLRYKGNLKIFFLKIVGLEIELVYSINHLGACSRFSEVYNLLKDEHAVRVYAVVSTGLLKLAPFLRMNVGAGVAWVISVDTPGRNIAKLHAEASVLGITVGADVFLTEKGNYFYLEGKVWNAFKASLSVSFETNENTGLIDTVLVKGTLLANGGDGSSFQDSYCDGMRKLVSKLSDEADKRISQVQMFYTKAQNALTDAQDWLEEKKAKLRNANAAFDAAVQSLEHAKAKLEEAKGPFRNALNKLNEAQRKVDNVCKVRSCKSICVPGLKCRICWKKVWFVKIPYPCCHFTSCMFSFPDPICVAFNLGCRAVRAVAYLALEAAKVFVRIPMLALDAAKLLVSGAQFVVDKSRVLLDIASGALDIAKVGLEGAKNLLEEQKIALEAIKKVVGWGLKAINFIIQYGVQSIIDARNCGFEIQKSIHDATVFRVVCEINLFRQGFKKVQLGINFGNPIQSIWQAAKGTVDALVDITDQEARQKREVKSRALSGLHQVIRIVREADMEADDFDVFLNDTIDTVFKTSGFKRNASSADFENRVEIFNEKCSVFTKSFDFFSESIQTLFEMVYETANTVNNASSIQDDLIGFDINEIVSNFSTESIGINTDAAFTDFKISSEDIEDAMRNAKQNLSNDPLLSDIDNLSKDAAELLQNQTNDANKIRILNQWIAVMENVTSEYVKEDDCVSFLDCAHYAIFQFYALFDAENVTNMTESLDAISLFEDLFLDLTGNLSYTVLEIQDLVNRLTENLEAFNSFNVFCSKPPSMMSKMANQRVKKGDTLRLICNATGDPPPNIWWYRNDEYLPEKRDIELVILNVSETDAQKYHCVAGNIVANLSSERVDVLVEDATEPDIVSQVTTSEIVLETKDITTDDVSIPREKQKAEESNTSNLTVILGTTLSAVMLVIVVGSTIAWRVHLRKKTRKSKAPGSIVSINMVRPDVQKRVFNAREVTDMNVDEF